MEPISQEIRSAMVPMKPRLTAVITSFNYARHLPVAVEAMASQSRLPDEFILIDDASTDGSQLVVDELARRYPFINVVKHEVNRGANYTANEALEMATSDYIYIGGADDMVLAGFFESAMAVLEKFPSASLCAGVPIHWEEEADHQFEACLELPRESGFIEPTELWPLARRGVLDMGGAWTFFRVADLRKFGGFPAPLKWLSDWFPIYGLALGRGLAWTGQPTAVMRFHSGNYSRVGPDKRGEQRAVLAHLAELISDAVPADVQAGFYQSGILGMFGWPMAKTLISKQRYWAQLSPAFWRVCLELLVYRSLRPVIRTVFPKWLRRTMAKKTVNSAAFDLAAMKAPKSL